MTRYVLTAALALVTASAGFAQPIPPGGLPQRPTFSPYLNLLNGGNPALNYYGLVLPQQQFQQQAGLLQQQITTANGDFQALQQQNRQLANGLINAYLPQTGNVAVFNNTGSYFNRIGGGAGGTGVGGAAGFNRGGGFQPSFARPGPTGGSGLNRPAAGGAGGLGGGGLGGFGR